MSNNDAFKEALARAVSNVKFGMSGAGIAVGKISDLDMKIEKKLAEEEEWIWVEGYKGTESDMTCRGYQFTLGGQTDMPDGVPIEVCESGFHFCLNLPHVYNYYTIGEGHRFFKVRGLVRKSDYEKYGTFNGLFDRHDKLAAKSIIFLSECTLDEIFDAPLYREWSEGEKRLALQESIGFVKNQRGVRTLIGYGYSEAFANWLINHGKYEIAAAVGSQPDLSMDMKCLAIFK